MAAVGWSANPYLALIDPSMRYGGPSPEMMYPQEQAPQQTGAATTGGFDTLTASPYAPTGGGESTRGLGPDVSGKMTAEERSMAGWGNPIGKGLDYGFQAMGWDNPMAQGLVGQGIKTGLNTAATLAAPAVAGVANPALGFMGLLTSLVLGADKRFADPNRTISAPSSVDMQSAVDRYGYGMPSPLGTTPTDLEGISNYGGISKDTGLNQSTMGLNEAMGIVGGGEGNGPSGPDAGGQSSGPGGGIGTSGGESPWAKGGVSRTKGFSKLAKYGEAGPEEAIFIPQRGAQHDMTKPGIQGNERQVKKALSSNLKKLRG